VLGRLPDLAEQVALRFLQSVCEQISQLYPPGARVILCSTGHVLSDVLSVRDEDVAAYRWELESFLERQEGHRLELFSLEHVFPAISYEQMRSALTARYAAPLEQVRESAAQEPGARALFNGLHRLMLEDEEVLHPERSPTKALVRSKELACRIIQRSDAWSALLAERFPGAVRLSIHPQLAHSEHLGLHLVRTEDPWLTPWHGVVLETGGTLTLVKRHEAERLNASLVLRDQRPSHFVAPAMPSPVGGAT
jgi:pyoverdine/dityrosine biosynthesis protein Dit1